jgi:hypothetical protein
MVIKIDCFGKKERKGQMAIWIIVALIFIILAVFYFMFFGNEPSKVKIVIQEPSNILDSCISLGMSESLELIMPQGGFLEPKNYRLYGKDKVPYLCDNAGNYLPCTNQHPLLLREITLELQGDIDKKIEVCFQEMKKEFELRNNEVMMGEMEYFLEIAKGQINIKINRSLTIKREDNMKSYDNFDLSFESPLYDMIKISNEIANQEAMFCYFEYNGYMIMYPEFLIEKQTLGDYTSIYSITHKSTGQKFNIAIRSCPIPPAI